MKKKYFILLVVIIVPVLLFCDTWYVDCDAAQTGNGSQALPFQTITEAINVLDDGDTIIIAEGTYYETLDCSDNYFDMRGYDAETTIIDGDDGVDRYEGIIMNEPDPEITGLSTFEDLTIQNCLATTNTDGGGFFIENRNVELINCIIKDNTSAHGDGGGIYFIGDDNYALTLESCTIKDNEAGANGGGLYFEGSYYEDLTITDCTISDNSCDEDGGGIYAEGDIGVPIEIDFEDLIICNNTAGYNSAGGGIYARCLRQQLGGKFDNILLYENFADTHGGALMFVYAYSTIAGNFEINRITAADNQSDDAEYAGLYIINSSVSVYNSIVYDNEWIGHNNPVQISSGNTVQYCCVEDGYTGTGNLSTDPQFRDPSSDDYRIDWNSPCLDSGVPTEYDEDDTVADMGYDPYLHDNWDFENSQIGDVTVVWRGFPRLEVADGDNDGEFVEATNVFDKFEYTDCPDDIQVWFENNSAYEDLLGHWDNNNDVYDWTPSTLNDYLCSLRGYKFKVWDDTGSSLLRTFGDVIDPETDITVYYQHSENWVNYLVPGTHTASRAFDSTTLNKLYKIVTKNWTAIKSGGVWGWPAHSTLSYGDLVILVHDNQQSDFTFNWQEPARDPGEPYVRPVPTQFSYTEDLEYYPIFMEFGEEVPLEVAVYVDNVCKGAEVVDADSMFQLRAYVLNEDPGYELEFVFYNGRSNRTVMDYTINDQFSQQNQSKLVTGNLGDFASIKFGKSLGEYVPELEVEMKTYPNPFNPTVTISFQAAEYGEVNLEIYNVKGQKVRTLLSNQTCELGDRISEIWKGNNDQGQPVSGGIYFIRMRTNSNIQTKKIMLLK